jgi:hypothetical protein
MLMSRPKFRSNPSPVDFVEADELVDVLVNVVEAVLDDDVLGASGVPGVHELRGHPGGPDI